MNKEVVVPYGNKKKIVKLDGTVKNVLAYPKDPSQELSSDCILESIHKPLGTPSLRKFLEHSRKLLVIVNDATRRTATARILEVICPYLERVNFRILVACGAHPKPKLGDLKTILGESYGELNEKTIFHDSNCREKMVYLGRSRRGTEYSINSLAIESDRILVITSVEPHYFAGFMGGRKSFLPGISQYETIVQNHRLSLHSMARVFSLYRNPVSNDMMELFEHLSPEKIFSIQLLQDREGKVTRVLCGNIQDAFFSLVDPARKLYGVKTGGRADILVSVVSSPNLSLYASRKAMNYGISGLKKGGILIVVSPCAKGLGDPEFFDPISLSRTPNHLIDLVSKDFKLGYQRLAKWAQATMWGDVWLVSNLPERAVRDAFLKPYNCVETAVRKAIRLKGTSSRITFLFDGTTTVPLP